MEIVEEQYNYKPIDAKLNMNLEKIQQANKQKNGVTAFNMYVPKLTKI